MNKPENDLAGLQQVLESIREKTVLVVGDVMLDRFVYGETNRISPESAAPVLDIKRETIMPGGAANVAVNLRALGGRAHLLGAIGDDPAGTALAGLMTAQGVDPAGLIRAPGRSTTEKTRFVAAGGQLIRADRETTGVLDEQTAGILLDRAGGLIGSADALVLSDYNKGVLSAPVIAALIACARAADVPVLVDPKKTNYSLYKDAYVITPNRKELADVSGLKAGTDAEISEAAEKVMEEYGLSRLVVTRSEDGMSVFTAGQPPVHVRGQAGEVNDVSGAGDTSIACLAAALAAGASLEQAASLANRAGGLVVAKAGTASVSATELQRSLGGKDLKVPLPGPDRTREAPLLAGEAALRQVRAWQDQGLRVGFTNGCFDILHFGHVNYLNRARDKCDRLVVALNRDISVRLLKGPQRPLHDENSRAAVLGALGAVDMVVLFGAVAEGEDNTPCALIAALEPDIYFKGGDYTIDRLPEARIVHAYGGDVEIMALYEGHSTTATIDKMKDTEAA